MKAADTLMASWITLTHALQTDVRATEDEMAGITAMNTRLDAAGDSTQPEDMMVLQVLKRIFTDAVNTYSAP